MNVNFAPQARDDLKSIRDYIAQYDERAADRVISRIRQAATMFEQFPFLGREGAIEDTREFAIPGLPYIIVYRIESETELDVLTVIHGRRDFRR